MKLRRKLRSINGSVLKYTLFVYGSCLYMKVKVTYTVRWFKENEHIAETAVLSYTKSGPRDRMRWRIM